MGPMRSAEEGLSGPRGLVRRRILAFLLVGVLLLCHGVYGVVHLCSASPFSAHQGHEHPDSMETGMVAHDRHPECHQAGASQYFAVLFAAFLGLALWLLFKGIRACAKAVAPFVVDRRLRPLVPHPPRDPTLPVIQVFRM